MATQFYIDNSFSPVQFECETLQGRILQNAKNLLMLHTGEAPYDRMMGISTEVFDKPLPYLKAHIMGEIGRVLAYEPDVRLLSVDVVQQSQGTIFVCLVEVEEAPEDRATLRI